MADGYARVTGSGTALIYMLPGTGNSVSNIYNAWRDETPLLVIASQQRSDLRIGTSSTGEADLLPLVKQFTTFAAEIPAGSSLAWWLEAATQRAYGPPSGPAFLSIPVDVLEDAAVVNVDREFGARSSVAPTDLSPVIEALRRAERPIVVVGGQVRRRTAADVLETFAEEACLPVFFEPGWNDTLSISPGHA